MILTNIDVAYQAPHGHPPAKTRRVLAGLIDKYKDKEKDKDGRAGWELGKDKSKKYLGRPGVKASFLVTITRVNTLFVLVMTMLITMI